MTIAQAFAAQLETENFGVVGQSIHLSKLPSSISDPTGNWLVEADGGAATTGGNLAKWQAPTTLVLNHWQDTAANLHAADEALHAAFAASLTLSGYTVVAYNIMPMEDLNEDDQATTYHGVWQIQITTLKEA